MSQPMLVTEKIKVRAYEVDAMGIVSNIVYVKWFEDLRHAFLDRYMPYEELLKMDLSPMLMRTEVNYLAPLTIHDSPVGEVWIAKLGKTKWVMEFRISSNGTVHCLGNQTGCVFNMKVKRPWPFPEAVQEAYQADLERLARQASCT
jgi:acyl-CoA thioester hydrolase